MKERPQDDPRTMLVERPGLILDATLLGRFSGIRVVADVHGAFDAFDAALRQAEEDGRFVLQLGDLIDRGPFSPFCVERMLEVEERGNGLMLLGNHEVAFARFVAEGQGGAVTRQATLMQFEEHGGGLTERYVARIGQGPLWIRAGEVMFVHAGFHPRMLVEGTPADEELQEIAIHGYGTSHERRAGTKARIWVDAIPRGLTVVVGHAVTGSRTVERVVGRHGGTAVFADTGFWTDEAGIVPLLDFETGPAPGSRPIP